MVLDLSNALIGGLDIVQLTDLGAALGKLGEIAVAIKDIVLALAEITAEKVALATDSGASLGAGFLAGLVSMHQAIIDEATAIARDAATALAGGGATVAGMGSPNYNSFTPELAGVGGAPTVYVDFSGPINASTPEQAQAAGAALGNAAANAAIVKLATVRRATTRGAAR